MKKNYLYHAKRFRHSRLTGSKVRALASKLISELLWRRKWQPTTVFLPGKSHGWRSLTGYSPWGRKESDTTEPLHFASLQLQLEKEMATHSASLPGKSHGQRSLAGCSPWGHKDLGTTEQLIQHSFNWQCYILQRSQELDENPQ